MKNVRTDDFIVQLAARATPITPLRPPAVRLLWWMIWAIAIAGIAVIAIGPRADLASAMTSPAYGASLAFLVIVTLTAGASSFVLSVPGAERSWMQRALPIAAAVAWPVAWMLAMTAAAGAGSGRTTRVFHTACAVEIFAIAAVTGWILLLMIRRAAPLRPWWTAATVSLASVGAASAATQVICPISDPSHQLIGHVLVAAAVGAVGAVVGRRLL